MRGVTRPASWIAALALRADALAVTALAIGR
jgi:hypothetical protein